MEKKINIIGGGLAGCEAAFQLAKNGFDVEIFEMRDHSKKEKVETFAHQTDKLAELVCSNSFRSDDIKTSIGILHEEMRILGSLILEAADKNKIPAGSALAIDREGFSNYVYEKLLETNKVTITKKEITNLPEDGRISIIATGPLTSDHLTKSIIEKTGEENLSFFDAIAPIIFHDSIDFDKAWMQSRYDKGDGKDYINCPLNKEQYFEFIDDLINGEKTEFKEWEKNTPYFEGCLPIETMASRGVETLRYGPLKPVGLTNQHNPTEKPYAIIQLRQDNKVGTIYNIVGFQTKLIYSEQTRIFRKIPGLEKAEFARLGGIHRNSFINSPKLLDKNLQLKANKNIYFAGQITGVEGYVESASMGLLAGIFCSSRLKEKKEITPDNKTAIGSLLSYITSDPNDQEESKKNNDFQPMNINFGLFDSLAEKATKKERKEAYSKRAIEEIKKFKSELEIEL